MKYPENIKEISTLNPDYLGFIFWEKSSRYMNLESIPEIPKSIKKYLLPHFIILSGFISL